MNFRRVICAVGVVAVMASCGTEESQEVDSGGDVVKVNQEKDTSYVQYISSNQIKEITAKGFAYKFGEPEGDGSILYKVRYNKDGYLLDSLIYNNNKVIATLSNIYDDQNNLLKSQILDSIGNPQQVVERTFNEDNEVNSFRLIQGEAVKYSQKMQYDEEGRMTKITEFDEAGNPRIITNYGYNENGKLILKEELDEIGTIMEKTVYVYDGDGNNSVQTVYGSNGQVMEKNFLKDYDKNGNVQIIEKYDYKDSLVVTYNYTYNDKGEEVKSIIFDGVGQIIRQSMSTFDHKGNQVLYEIYEGGKGFIGKDEIKYNENNQEVEMIVYDNKKKQLKRKVSYYNEKGLLDEVINYDKLDEPLFRITMAYQYFE